MIRRWLPVVPLIFLLFATASCNSFPFDLSSVEPGDCPSVTREMLEKNVLPPYTAWISSKEDGWKDIVAIRIYYCGPHEIEEQTWFATDKFPERKDVEWLQGTAWNYIRGTMPTRSILRRYKFISGTWVLQRKSELDWVEIERELNRNSKGFPH